MPEKLIPILGLAPEIKAIPIVEPDPTYTIGLIAGPRQPITPLVSAFMREAKRIARIRKVYCIGKRNIMDRYIIFEPAIDRLYRTIRRAVLIPVPVFCFNCHN